MNHSVWQLDPARYRASLQLDQLAAEVALDRPQLGWQALRYEGQAIDIAPVQIFLEPDLGTSVQPPASMHVRGMDVVATYPASEQRPFTTQIYRGVAVRQVGGHSLLALSSLISLNTHLLDARPAIVLRTNRQPGSTLLTGDEAGFRTAGQANSQEDSPAALLLRPDDGHWSYLELWHAVDYLPWTQEPASWDHRFTEPLEKGVIRRLLVWSMLLPRADDLVLAADLHQQFLETAPPLAT
jgi:hypothetical protein